MIRSLPSAVFLTICLSVPLPLPGQAVATPPAGLLESGFASPPAETKPWCYWYWISDNLSREGITRDLEAMARVGIGEALIGNIFLDDVPAGTVKMLAPSGGGSSSTPSARAVAPA